MIGVLGTSHRCADLSTREAIAKALGTCDENLRKGSVFLLTCNRAEWYFCTSTPAKTHQEMVASIREAVGHDALCHLYTFFGLECFHHLGKVVSGLDSLFVGETEIQGQVRAAYEAAREQQALPKELHFLFQRALHTGKVVRERIQLPVYQGLCEQVSLLASQHMKEVGSPSALVIGTSTMNRAIAHSLKKTSTEVTIVNRTDQRARDFASEIGGEAILWEELPRLWCQFPCVIAATRSSEYLLRTSDHSASSALQLLIDLGVPRNIDPALSSPTRRIVNIESFTPSQEIESVLSTRSWNDYLRLAQRNRDGIQVSMNAASDRIFA